MKTRLHHHARRLPLAIALLVGGSPAAHAQGVSFGAAHSECGGDDPPALERLEIVDAQPIRGGRVQPVTLRFTFDRTLAPDEEACVRVSTNNPAAFGLHAGGRDFFGGAQLVVRAPDSNVAEATGGTDVFRPPQPQRQRRYTFRARLVESAGQATVNAVAIDREDRIVGSNRTATLSVDVPPSPRLRLHDPVLTGTNEGSGNLSIPGYELHASESLELDLETRSLDGDRDGILQIVSPSGGNVTVPAGVPISIDFTYRARAEVARETRFEVVADEHYLDDLPEAQRDPEVVTVRPLRFCASGEPRFSQRGTKIVTRCKLRPTDPRAVRPVARRR